MTFPVVQATATSRQTPAGTTHTITLPAGVTSGDLLLAIINTSASITAFSGWTSLGTGPNGFGSVWYRVATGTDGNTFTTGASDESTHNTYRITGYTATPEAASANSVNDPPSLTPSWGAADTLWIAAITPVSLTTAGDITAAPTNYTGLIKSAEGSIGFNPARTGSAVRSLNAASENPGAFTTSTYTFGDAFTVGVRPAASATPVKSRGYIMG